MAAGLMIPLATLLCAAGASGGPFLTARLDAGPSFLLGDPDRYAQRLIGGALSGTGGLGLATLGTPDQRLLAQLDLGWIGFPAREGGQAAALVYGSAGPGLRLPLPGGGLHVELGARLGGGVTGGLGRLVVVADFALCARVGPVTMGPSVRYLQVVEGSAGEQGNASIVLAGLSLGWAKAESDTAALIVPRRGAAAQAPGPLPDEDGDGVPDKDDRCAGVAGSATTEGCPPADRDRDRVVDALDRCPDLRGTRPAGCPAEILATRGDAQIALADQVSFEAGTERVVGATSLTLLDQVAEILKANPSLRIRVDGHAAERGSPANNLKLSVLRAESVRQALIDRGVAPERLEAIGYGESKPVEDKPGTRIELTVLDAPAP